MNKLKDKSRYMVGIYSDEDQLMNAVKKIKNLGVKIQEVYSPYPIHHLDTLIGHPRTRIPIAAFMFGALGTTLALWMMTWMLGIDWPMVIGGKNFIPIPDLVPVTFELTVLISALGMVTTFMITNSLGPGKKEFMFDRRTTDDKFAVVINLNKNQKAEREIEEILVEFGAEQEPKPKIVEK